MTMAMQSSKFIPLYGPDFSGKAVAQGLFEPPDQAKAEASNTSFWLVLDHRGNTVSLCMRYRKRPPESLQSQKKRHDSHAATPSHSCNAQAFAPPLFHALNSSLSFLLFFSFSSLIPTLRAGTVLGSSAHAAISYALACCSDFNVSVRSR